VDPRLGRQSSWRYGGTEAVGSLGPIRWCAYAREGTHTHGLIPLVRRETFEWNKYQWGMHGSSIRLTLGAQPLEVIRLILGQGGRIALTGILIGIAGALSIGRVLSSLLFGVTATDPVTFVVVTLLFCVIALVACYIPAQRAVRVDPMVALRYE